MKYLLSCLKLCMHGTLHIIRDVPGGGIQCHHHEQIAVHEGNHPHLSLRQPIHSQQENSDHRKAQKMLLSAGYAENKDNRQKHNHKKTGPVSIPKGCLFILLPDGNYKLVYKSYKHNSKGNSCIFPKRVSCGNSAPKILHKSITAFKENIENIFNPGKESVGEKPGNKFGIKKSSAIQISRTEVFGNKKIDPRRYNGNRCHHPAVFPILFHKVITGNRQKNNIIRTHPRKNHGNHNHGNQGRLLPGILSS